MNYLKSPTFRSEAWRRAVASLPCCCCGLEGPSQAAHRNEGKGMGIKTSDAWTVPLCTSCHADFDQGRYLTREERRALFDRWLVETIDSLASSGIVKAKP